MSHAKSRDCLFGSLKGNVQHGFKKLRLRRWNSTGSWVNIALLSYLNGF